MYYGRKKAIIIAVITTILVAILTIIGFFVYTKTDLLKSSETLFFKYVGQTLENFKFEENTQITEIENLKQEKPYTVVGSLSYEAEENNDVNDDILSRMKLNIESKVNKPEEKAYTKAKLDFDSQDLFTLEYVNSNNIYALKSDEIVTAFLGIENDNLKVLAQKLEISDTTGIPDTFQTININEILKISEDEKAHIKETYLPVLIDTISKENFTKETGLAIEKQGVTYNTTAYRLELNSEELKQVKIALLTTLGQDSITLNLITTKAKLLGLDENYTEVNNLNKEIEKQIRTISNGNTTLDAGLNIITYVASGKVITTEIIIRNETKLSFYGDIKENSSTKYVAIEDLSATAEYNKIEIQLDETRSLEETTFNILANIDDETEISAYITNTGTAAENNLNTNAEVTFTQGEEASTINYSQETIFQDEIEDIIELDRSNCGVLNDYTTEQLQVLIRSIMQRIEMILNQKAQAIGWKTSQGNSAENKVNDITNENNLREEYRRQAQETVNDVQEALNSVDN